MKPRELTAGLCICARDSLDVDVAGVARSDEAIDRLGTPMMIEACIRLPSPAIEHHVQFGRGPDTRA